MLGFHDPILMSIFFKWVGSTTNYRECMPYRKTGDFLRFFVWPLWRPVGLTVAPWAPWLAKGRFRELAERWEQRLQRMKDVGHVDLTCWLVGWLVPVVGVPSKWSKWNSQFETV